MMNNISAQAAFEKAFECNQQGNFEEMMKYLDYAANKGHLMAMHQKGYMLLFQDRKEEAINWLTKAGEGGLIEAFYTLGNCFYYGQCCISQDYAKAIPYFKIAAEQGHPQAQCNLGACYYYGQGTQVDYDKAFEWYSKSAAQGEANAQFNVGVCYENGQGVAEDRQKAFMFFKEAAQQGHERAEARVNLYLKASKQ